MVNVLAQAEDGIVQGNFDLSDTLMIIAFVVFVVATVVAVIEKTWVTALLAAGLALVALAFFVA